MNNQAANWLTPKASDGRDKGTTTGDMLSNQAKQWPTPGASDAEHGLADQEEAKRMAGRSPQLRHILPTLAAGQPDQDSPSTVGKPRGSLNSMWVAQLQGWPDEYAAELTKALCEYWETAGATRSPSQSSRPSRTSTKG